MQFGNATRKRPDGLQQAQRGLHNEFSHRRSAAVLVLIMRPWSWTTDILLAMVKSPMHHNAPCCMDVLQQQAVGVLLIFWLRLTWFYKTVYWRNAVYMRPGSRKVFAQVDGRATGISELLGMRSLQTLFYPILKSSCSRQLRGTVPQC